MIFQVSCFIPGPSPLTPSASSSSSRNSCSSMRPQSSACRAASSLKSEKNKSTAPIRIATWSAPPNHDARIRIFKRGQLLGQLKKKNQLKKTYGRLGRRIAAGSLQDRGRIAAGSANYGYEISMSTRQSTTTSAIPILAAGFQDRSGRLHSEVNVHWVSPLRELGLWNATWLLPANGLCTAWTTETR